MSLPKVLYASLFFAIALPISTNAKAVAQEIFIERSFDTIDIPVQLVAPPSLQSEVDVIIVQSGSSRRRVLSFRTQSYTVRVDSESGTYLMSVYDRRNDRQILDRVPAEASNGSASIASNDRPIGTVFSAEQGNLTYTAFENATGNPTLIILPPQED